MMNGTETGITWLKPAPVPRQIEDYCARRVVGTRKGKRRLGRTLKCNASIKQCGTVYWLGYWPDARGIALGGYQRPISKYKCCYVSWDLKFLANIWRLATGGYINKSTPSIKPDKISVSNPVVLWKTVRSSEKLLCQFNQDEVRNTRIWLKTIKWRDELGLMCSGSVAVGSKKARIWNGLDDQTKEMSGARSAYEMKINAYKVQVGKPEGKRPPGRSRCRWKDKILT
jgi:hypothetical protein